MKALIIGPGRIGCGFAAQLLRASGHAVVLAGREPAIDLLRRHRRFVVRLADPDACRDLLVDGVEAFHISDENRLRTELRSCDLVATAVGAPNLSEVLRRIAPGLGERDVPVNVVAFENLTRPGQWMRQQIAPRLPDGYPVDEHGFSGAVVSRAVSRRIWPTSPGEPFVFVGDPFSTFHVDRCSLRAPIPDIEGMIVTDRFDAFAQRKLYMYSAGHAACAYIGHLKGYNYIHAAIRDPEVRTGARAAIEEGQRALRARYGDAIAGDPTDVDALIARFDNAALGDTITRVGRDPRRKLSHDDRIVGPATQANDYGVGGDALALAAAAAMCFSDPTDTEARTLHRALAEEGIGAVLGMVCGVTPGARWARRVTAQWQSLQPRRAGNVLVNIEARKWAWQPEPSR